ncbi:hypothetical protein ACFWOJ_34775 [Streptomyces sp. NPDC058439]
MLKALGLGADLRSADAHLASEMEASVVRSVLQTGSSLPENTCRLG